MLTVALLAAAGASGIGSGAGSALNQIIAADVAGYNIYTHAGSPGTRVDVTVTIAPGVRVGSMVTGSWIPGSTVKIVNHGIIQGAGGNATAAGGDALSLGFDTTVDNTDGFIYGGGGGGSPGAPGDNGGRFEAWGGGGGGGGGQGYPGGLGGNGTGGGSGGSGGDPGHDGTPDAQGAGGGAGSTSANGGGGGGYGGGAGSAGGNSDANNVGVVGTNIGAAGRAIRLNGHGVTWIGGHDSVRVKGAVA
jgi:hypothetical protein